VSVVHQSAEHGIGDGGIGNDFMPAIDWQIGTWLVMMVEPR